MSEHGHDHGPVVSRTDDPVPSTTILVGLVGAILLLLIGVMLQALYLGVQQREYERKVVAAAPAELTEVTAEQKELLEGYRWIDKEQGVVAIPVEQAVGLVIEDYRRRGRAPGGAGSR